MKRIALVLILLLAGCTAPQPSATVLPSESVPQPSSSAQPLDTANWTMYESQRYGYRLMHPPGWTATPAEKDSTMADAKSIPSTGEDVFVSPAGDVAVLVWSTPTEDFPETIEGVGGWVERYCEEAGSPCPGIQERAVPLCNERWDCHPGLLVTLQGAFPQAFFTGGEHSGRMVIVASGRPEWHDSVAKYGGSRRLLEGFLSTMDVCPARPNATPAGCPQA